MGLHYQRGMLLYGQKRYDMAADEFRQELGQLPNSALAMSMLGLSLTYDDKRDEGMENARQAVTQDPERAFCHYALACTIVGNTAKKTVIVLKIFRWAGLTSYQRRVKRALPSAMEAVELDPDNADYLALVSAIELDLGRTKKALEWADQGLAANPNHIRCANMRAKALSRRGRVKEAKQTLNAALSVDPENASTHATSGWTHLKSGQKTKAVEHFKESLRLNPNSKDAQRGLTMAKRGGVTTGLGIGAYFLFQLAQNVGSNQNNVVALTAGVCLIAFLVVIIFRAVRRR